MDRLVKYFLKNKAFSWLLLLLVFTGGIWAYIHMGKLEDAPFTIKQAVVTTTYPGASASEVQQQVTDILEESIQSLGELYYLKTENRAGLSKITVYTKKEIRADEMQQLWDKLRRKVADVQHKLPEGAGPSQVNDDFGDVLGVFYGIYSNQAPNRELEAVARRLKNELLQVEDVARVEICGVQTPTIELEIDPSVMARTGITRQDLVRAFEKQNKMVDAGSWEMGNARLRIDVQGSFTTLDEIEHLTVTSASGAYFRLGDIARIHEGYLSPARQIMRIGNVPAVGVAISTVPDGNVVDMARLVEQTVEEFQQILPAGMHLVPIYDQGKESAEANNGFVWNLIISVVTVVAILLFFIGWKNGLLIGSSLVFTIFATLIYMWTDGIALQRMSLAAIIIAMGMLVDNAIVVSDSALVGMQYGLRKRDAVVRSVTSTAIPLLAATAIAILTFMPVYLSPHITGELLSSLFIVIAVSLSVSWLFAITQTPFFIQEFVRRPRPDELRGEPYSGPMYDRFRKVIGRMIHYKWVVTGSMVVLLVIAGYGFRSVPKVFMPQLNKQFFTIDMWLPEGVRIETMDKQVQQVCQYIRKFPQTKQVSTFVGQTPPRYYLANSSFGPQPNYAQCLVEAGSPEEAHVLQELFRDSLSVHFPDLFLRVNRFELNSIPEAMIEARFRGPDARVLDSLTQVALGIMRQNPKVANARREWGNMAMTVEAGFDPVKSGRLGLTKESMVQATKALNEGVGIGVYRDKDKQVPVLLHLNDTVTSVDGLGDVSVWNGTHSAPLAQVIDGIEIGWEWPYMRTYNRQLSMSAMCDARYGNTMAEVHAEIREAVETIKLPEGYSFFWDAQYKDQSEAMEALTKYFPLAFLLLVLILVALFGNFRQPLIIFLILPLSLIGMIVGLLLTGYDFGFFCIAGWLGLLGMIVKNVIVLIDEINNQVRLGLPVEQAVVEATVMRTRPVLMAATTTVFGMVPLLFDVVFGGMAATIVFGLTFATVLTLFVTPALYAIFYRLDLK